MGRGSSAHAGRRAAHAARHAAALVGAAAARLGTFLAMGHLMPAAFVAASLADIGTQLTYHACHLASPGHVTGSHSANGCTIDVKGDASRHGFHILLLQAGCGTVIAGARAVITGFDTRFELSMCHSILHSKKIVRESRDPDIARVCTLQSARYCAGKRLRWEIRANFCISLSG